MKHVMYFLLHLHVYKMVGQTSRASSLHQNKDKLRTSLWPESSYNKSYSTIVCYCGALEQPFL